MIELLVVIAIIVKLPSVEVPPEFQSDSMTFMRNEPYDFYMSYLRHQGKANVLLCDGHVESPTPQFLFDDTSDAVLDCWNRDHQPHREALP